MRRPCVESPRTVLGALYRRLHVAHLRTRGYNFEDMLSGNLQKTDALYRYARNALWGVFFVYFLYEIVQLPMLPILMLFDPLGGTLLPHLLWLVSIPVLLRTLRSKSGKRPYLIGGAIFFWIFSANLVHQEAYGFDLPGTLTIIAILLVVGLFVSLLARDESGSVGHFSLFLVAGLAAAKVGQTTLLQAFPSLRGGEENFIFNAPVLLALPWILLCSFLVGGTKSLSDYFFPSQSTGMLRANAIGAFFGFAVAGAYVAVAIAIEGSNHIDIGAPFFFVLLAVPTLLYCAFTWPVLRWILKRYGKLADQSFDKKTYPILWGSLACFFSIFVTLIGISYILA